MPRKKKTEAEEEKALKKKSKKDRGKKDKVEKKTVEKAKEKAEATEEFPDTDIAIDVFSAPKDSRKSEKMDKEKLEKIKQELVKKAKKLAEQIDEKTRDIKEEVKKSEVRKRMKKIEGGIFPLDDYVRYSAHLGTKAVTPHMRQFVYKRRADGIAVMNTTYIDEKLKEAIGFLKDFKPEDVFLACKREVGWQAAKKFSEVTGIRIFTKKYPAGIITNMKLVDFFETELIIICDPWLDKNALNDAIKIKVPVIGLCDTNNFTKGITKIIPCNNKAAKSIGLILYLLAKEYLKERGENVKLNLEDFTGETVERAEKGAKEGV